MSVKSNAEHREIEIELLDENPNNVNEMSDATFNQLCEDIQGRGFVPTITVTPRGDRYFIVDGNHRKRAAVLCEFTHVPCDVVDLSDEELQEVLSAKIAIVRGTVNKTKLTTLWYRIRQSLDERAAMQALGITSELQLKALVRLAKRKTDAKTIADDAVATMVARAKRVENLATVIRAATGDGGLGEFQYLIFQHQGSTLVLVRCQEAHIEQMKVQIGLIEERRGDVADVIVSAVQKYVNG